MMGISSSGSEGQVGSMPQRCKSQRASRVRRTADALKREAWVVVPHCTMELNIPGSVAMSPIKLSAIPETAAMQSNPAAAF